VIAWVHGSAPDAPLAIARAASPCRFFHVLGSAAREPGRADDGRPAAFAAVPGITYHEVILGFVIHEGSSRWLRNDEISAGVLRAVESDAARSIVDVVEPWAARP